MTPERYRELTANISLELNQEEIDEGWHFCMDWDGLLIHKSWPEYGACSAAKDEPRDG